MDDPPILTMEINKKLFRKKRRSKAQHFVCSFPVSVLVTGAESAEMMQEKMDLAKSFDSMEEE